MVRENFGRGAADFMAEGGGRGREKEELGVGKGVDVLGVGVWNVEKSAAEVGVLCR